LECCGPDCLLEEFPSTKAWIDGLPSVLAVDIAGEFVYQIDLNDEQVRVVIYWGALGWYRVGFPSLEAMRALQLLSDMQKH